MGLGSNELLWLGDRWRCFWAGAGAGERTFTVDVAVR